MTDNIQLIYNKIENRIDEICDDGFVLKENQQEYETLTDLEDFIDSLPKEPASEDLEEAANFYANTHTEWFDSEGNPCIMPAFKAGAEWQKQQMKEVLQTEYEKGRFDMREEMMKDVVDATIFSELKSSDGSLFQVKSDRFRMNSVKISDRIKVIPIKPEQQNEM